MIILNSTDSLRITTTNTNNIDYVINFVDINTSTKVITYGSFNGSINTATTTNISGSPASGFIRQIKSVQIENVGTSVNNIGYILNNGTNDRSIFSAKLNIGENLNVNINGEFLLYSADGSLKTLNTSTTFENYISSAKQKIVISKIAPRTSVATIPFSIFNLNGNPGSGVLAGTSTTSGVIPTSSTSGFPLINSFSSSKGQIGAVQFSNTVACRMTLYDCLFKAGTYGFATGTTTLSSQPSYASRIPTNSNYNDTEIWIEVTTAFVTGTAWQVQVTYTNQSGVTGRTSIISSAQAAASLTLGKMFQLALQSGDIGIQKIESVIVTNGGTAMTAGAFNVLVMRRLVGGRIKIANDTHSLGLTDSGMPEIFQTSALYLIIIPDSTSTGVPEVFLDVIG